jgi:hypothetical protein
MNNTSRAPPPSTALDGGDPNCYYEYHHGSGTHILRKPDPDVNRTKYSVSCICQNFCDILIFVGCIAFLFFAIRYAFYCLENSDGGD